VDSLISFDDIPFSVEAVTMLKTLGLRDDFFEEIHEMADRTNELGRPRAVVRALAPQNADENSLALGGERIESRLVASLLKKCEQVFCFVVTSGVELDALVQNLSDPVEKLWQGQMNQAALRQAANWVRGQVRQRFQTGQLCAVNPGSNPLWPLEAQNQLFRIIGDVRAHTGVALTPSCLMLPVKSVSGIWFPSRRHYSNCAICQRQNCEGRGEPFDEGRLSEIISMEA